MKLLIDARTLQDRFPGIGRYTYNLIDALAPQLEGELLVITPHAPRPTHHHLNPLARHPNLTLIPTDIPVFNWRAQAALPRLIRSLQPDLVHFPYNVRPFWLGLPSVLTLYDVIPRRFPGYYPRRSRLQIEIIQRLAIRSSHAFVAISQAAAEDFRQEYGIPAGRIAVTPLAADPIFRPQPVEIVADLRRRLALPQRYVLYLGSNKPHKNLPRLIEAWARSEQSTVNSQQSTVNNQRAGGRGQGATLIIAGAWDERYPEAKRLVEQQNLAGTVRFLGPVANADLPALYAGAELFVFPSLYEGFGLPVLEAMACGAAVACSHTSSLPEVAGDAALFFDPEDAAALAAALTRLLADSDLRADLARRGSEQAGRFSWERTAKATLPVYRKLLG